jgi:hypothetical protein
VDRDAPDVVAEQLDLAGVQPGPDLEAVLGQLGPDGVGGTDRPGLGSRSWPGTRSRASSLEPQGKSSSPMLAGCEA